MAGRGSTQEPIEVAAGAAPDWSVQLAQRSAQLMKLAARLLVERSSHILITDLTWPSYRQILLRECTRAGRLVTNVSIRKRILKCGLTANCITAELARVASERRCDALLLPAVDNFGIRLPVAEITESIEQETKLLFVVVDAAQSLGHVPLGLWQRHCDFVIAGCHKWLGAYHPLGMAFYGRPRSMSYVNQVLHRLQAQGVVDDPLLQFTGEMERECPQRFGETVNLSPLFSCQGALLDARRRHVTTDLRQRLRSADALAEGLQSSSWAPLIPRGELRSGIMLLQSRKRAIRRMDPQLLRSALHRFGLAASTYSRGIVRLSCWAGEPQEVAVRSITRALGSMTAHQMLPG